ncbi:ATP-dependent helicase [Lentisphaera profundi]|uniref:DNA 3'-5' helicase n=1 Tax=Lentisphaera profundi TaxID=1658616 RepID=A0ABY7VZC4_9BACT|nr:ATP-dependent helicase [Lentisphaera profundi]WDE99286.1 ATP-dependent helicase [Lentisphaera profundi]
MSLNNNQQLAVNHESGPILLLAGAGTGKTHTLCCRVARLIESGVPAEKILMLTFTRKAADEMKQRVESINDQHCAVLGGTFHSIAFNDLKYLGLMKNLGGIFDDSAQAKYLRKELKKKSFEKISDTSPREFMRFFSLCSNTLEDERIVLSQHFPSLVVHADLVLTLSKNYVKHKEKLKAFDYDDILKIWLSALKNKESLSLAQQCQYILVDEYQDTSKLQIEILKNLCRHHQNIMAVGDDCQSIYSFRGALPEQIAHFTTDFPGSKSLALEENYRSTKQILDFANSCMIDAKNIIPKELRPASDCEGNEPDFFYSSYYKKTEKEICRDIFDLRTKGTPFEQQAILYRSSMHCLYLELELTRQGIPYKKYGGKKITDKSHVKKFSALLSYVFSDEIHILALQQCLELMPGLGIKTLEKILTQLNEGLELKDINLPLKSQVSFEQLNSFRKMSISKNNLEDLIAFACPLIFKDSEDNSKKIKDLNALSEELRRIQNWDDFFSDIILNIELNNDDDMDAVVLSTIHSAKGKEWQSVHILAINENAIPIQNSNNLEEERRLLYVAVTRAKQHLKLYVENSKELKEVSRFVKHLIPQKNPTPAMAFNHQSLNHQSLNQYVNTPAEVQELVYVSENTPETALVQSDMDELTYIPFYD